MATLVLSVVGSVVAGPIGGAIGAVIGQQIDREVLFKPKGRQGPRMGELAVQTSSYGSAIPKLFGTMRVAGTVIWATELIEHRSRSGGKGRPTTTTYSYSANFAVALSGRQILQVRRIWADGKLLRGAAGDFKTETMFRLHRGDEGQAVDPLIASAEGIGAAPAYRGIAYAVFENFQLGDYGNRIPLLTFEVEADAGPVTIAAIAVALSEGAIGGAAPLPIGGYAASGDSVRGAIETLARAAPLSLADTGSRLLLCDGSDAPVTLAPEEFSAPRREERRGAALLAPGEVSISYYEPARDHQAGLQRARRPGAGRRHERIDLPAALSAEQAKAIAEANLARGWTERVRRSVRLPWRRIALTPSRIVAIAGEPGLWRVTETVVERMTLVLSLVRFRSGSAPAGSDAEPGRPAPAPDAVHGPTVLHGFELPDPGDAPASIPRIFVAAAGASPGWRRAALSLSLDGRASWNTAGVTAPPATIGAAEGVLGAGSPHMFDDLCAIEVVLLNGAMQLGDADDVRLVAGANLALLGDELIQFGHAVPLGGARYRLSHLLRGRRGTEFAIGSHEAGERFVLIEPETLMAIDIPASAIGSDVALMASGVGDVGAVEQSVPMTGISVAPPSPVAFTARPISDGGYHLTWTRRSRLGWRWLDGVEVAIGEEREAYRLTVLRGGVTVRVAEIGTTQFTYDAAMVAADRGDADALTLSLVQMGSIAGSMPEILQLAWP